MQTKTGLAADPPCDAPCAFERSRHMHTRSATIEDIPLLRSLAQRIWRECYPGIIRVEQIEFMLEWMYSEEQLRREIAEGVVWEVVEETGEAIGFLSFQREADGRVKLNKLYLLPEHQGRGHSRGLLDRIMGQAQALGAHEVWLQVNKRNARAVAAYKKAGFEIAEETVFDIGGGFVMDDYLMAGKVHHTHKP
jgi:ribosomal protein S18 acetylase RimI-like enzyme